MERRVVIYPAVARDGILASKVLSSVGIETLVCSGSEEVTELSERADVVVPGPEGVVAHLSTLADRIKTGRAKTDRPAKP